MNKHLFFTAIASLTFIFPLSEASAQKGFAHGGLGPHGNFGIHAGYKTGKFAFGLHHHGRSHPHYGAIRYPRHCHYYQPAIFVGPTVYRYSNGATHVTQVSPYYNSIYATPGVNTRRSYRRGPFGSSVIADVGNIGFPATTASIPSTSSPSPSTAARPGAQEWLNAGVPVGGPVGTWYEDDVTPGVVVKHVVHADGNYERSAFRRTANGKLEPLASGDVAKKAPFEFKDGNLVLDPKGTLREGPFAVSLSVNLSGQTRVNLHDTPSGGVRHWRSKP